jgi:hypothetical protein
MSMRISIEWKGYDGQYPTKLKLNGSKDYYELMCYKSNVYEV